MAGSSFGLGPDALALRIVKGRDPGPDAIADISKKLKVWPPESVQVSNKRLMEYPERLKNPPRKSLSFEAQRYNRLRK